MDAKGYCHSGSRNSFSTNLFTYLGTQEKRFKTQSLLSSVQPLHGDHDLTVFNSRQTQSIVVLVRFIESTVQLICQVPKEIKQ